MKIITELKKEDLSGRIILVRVDFNVPLKRGKVFEAYRINQSLPTINYLVERGARIILISHLGDDGKKSLAPIAKYLNSFFSVKLIKNLDQQKINQSLNTGQIVLLENLRRWEGEKKNDLSFAKKLAALADIYVNEAFSVSHRAHASVVGVTRYLPNYAGLLFAQEFKNLSLALKPKHPFIVILGGLKFKTKIPLLKKLSKTADQIFIGGALANSFMKAMGCEIGDSMAEEDLSYLKPFLKNKKIVLPVDLVWNKKRQIVDVGPKTLCAIELAVQKAKLVVWNGPLGWFEIGAKEGTLEVAKIIANSKGFSLVGGGDTLSAIEELELNKQFNFVSTAGGAMLDFLATGTLPGIKTLK